MKELRRLHSPQVDKRQTFGIIHRDPQPSMFDILTWNVPEVQKRTQRQSNRQEIYSQQNYIPINTPIIIEVKPMQLPKEIQPVITSIKSVPCLSYNQEKIKFQRPITNNLYEYEEIVPVSKNKKLIKEEKKIVSPKRPYSISRSKMNVKNQIVNKKPPFATYGRGNTNSQYNYLKSHNVIPHSGKNKPEQNETDQSALLIASKHKISSIDNIEEQPDKTVVYFDSEDRNKTRTILSAKRLQNSRIKNRKNMNDSLDGSDQYFQLQSKKQSKKQGKKVKKQAPLKFMNQRQDFIQSQRQDQVKKNRLALKPTQCYPGQYSVKTVTLAESHSSTAIAAGKKNPVHSDIRQIFDTYNQ